MANNYMHCLICGRFQADDTEYYGLACRLRSRREGIVHDEASMTEKEWEEVYNDSVENVFERIDDEIELHTTLGTKHYD